MDSRQVSTFEQGGMTSSRTAETSPQNAYIVGTRPCLPSVVWPKQVAGQSRSDKNDSEEVQGGRRKVKQSCDCWGSVSVWRRLLGQTTFWYMEENQIKFILCFFYGFLSWPTILQRLKLTLASSVFRPRDEGGKGGQTSPPLRRKRKPAKWYGSDATGN